MATLEDLEREVRKLRRQVEQSNGNAAAARTVDEIVQPDDNDDKIIGGGPTGGFSAACAQSRTNLVERQKREAAEELRDNPGRVKTPAALHGFRMRYSAVPTDDLDDIVREFAR